MTKWQLTYTDYCWASDKETALEIFRDSFRELGDDLLDPDINPINIVEVDDNE